MQRPTLTQLAEAVGIVVALVPVAFAALVFISAEADIDTALAIATNINGGAVGTASLLLALALGALALYAIAFVTVDTTQISRTVARRWWLASSTSLVPVFILTPSVTAVMIYIIVVGLLWWRVRRPRTPMPLSEQRWSITYFLAICATIFSWANGGLWLPYEDVQTRSAGHFTAYVLSESEENLVVLRRSPGVVLRFGSDDVVSRNYCIRTQAREQGNPLRRDFWHIFQNGGSRTWGDWRSQRGRPACPD
jgi:hypothetical protein